MDVRLDKMFRDERLQEMLLTGDAVADEVELLDPEHARAAREIEVAMRRELLEDLSLTQEEDLVLDADG